MALSEPKFLLVSILLLTCCGVLTKSANIIFLFGGGNASHKMSIWPFVVALGDNGHKVTFLSSNEKQPSQHPNVTDITPKAWKDYTSQLYKVDRLQERIDGTHWTIFTGFYEDGSRSVCNLTLNQIVNEPSFHNLFFKVKYDLVVINSIFGECYFYLAHYIGAKTIVYDPSMFMPWYHGVYGIPIQASWVPHLDSGVSYPMGILERLMSVYKYFITYDGLTSLNEDIENMQKAKLGFANIPTLVELERNASLVLINSHHSTDFARSLPPMMVNIGGMQCWNPVGDTPKVFQEFMDGAEEGVILIAFGTTIDLSSISPTILQMFFNTMRKYSKVRFIWRWDGDMPEGHPENIMATSWLPQREILNHPKTIGFMTHCGLNSIHEATFHGVPLIALPLFADQDLSANRIHAQEIGVRIEARDLTQETMDSAIGEIIYNPKYRKNMGIRSKIFRDRPQSPIEEAVFWTEFVLRNDDTSALKPMLLDQSYWIRYSVDVFLVFACFSISIPILLAAIVKRIITCFY